MERLFENPVHFVSLPSVPLPTTCRFGPAAIGLMLNELPLGLAPRSRGISENPARLDGRACASSFENENSSLSVSPLLASLARLAGLCA
jgi:hypothetical protein